MQTAKRPRVGGRDSKAEEAPSASAGTARAWPRCAGRRRRDAPPGGDGETLAEASGVGGPAAFGAGAELDDAEELLDRPALPAPVPDPEGRFGAAIALRGRRHCDVSASARGRSPVNLESTSPRALHVEGRKRRFLAPRLLEDDDRANARRKRTVPVEPAAVSDSAEGKAYPKDTRRAARAQPPASARRPRDVGRRRGRPARRLERRRRHPPARADAAPSSWSRRRKRG